MHYLLPVNKVELSLAEVVEEFVLGLACLGRLEDMRRIDELDLSVSQARILFLLETANEPLPIHVLAEQARLSMAAAGRNIEHLVQVGIVSREESATDRRVKLISATSHGREIIAMHLNARHEAVERFVERLPESERAALHAALRGVLQCGALSEDPHLPAETPIGARP
ncbi:MAG TPA: MarR family transcriptional regulator [Actinobacteria bacterium]|nr:MarR family transcriptional regulator [Actinomycetota bacterium]